METEEFVFTDGCFFKKQPIKSPEAVIKEFYTIWSIEYVQIMIWKLFKGAIDSEAQVFNVEEEILDIIFFIETFMMFNMAVHELNQRNKSSE